MEENSLKEEMTEQEIRPVNKFFGAPGNGNVPQDNSSVSKALLILVGVVILLLIGTSIYLLRNKFTGSKEEEKPTTIEISSPSPYPTPQFDRSKFTLRILNGTKTSGLAASVSAKLKNLGYKTSKEGNATSSAFKRTEVRVKETSQGLLEQLIKDLMPDYDATTGANLKDIDEVDGEVILGVK